MFRKESTPFRAVLSAIVTVQLLHFWINCSRSCLAQEPTQHANSTGGSRPSSRDSSADGLHFNCNSKQEVVVIKKQMLKLFEEFGWNHKVVRIQDNGSNSVAFHLVSRGHNEDTDTLTLKDREDLDIEDESVETIRAGKPKPVRISSKKEIIAQMLSKGRATTFEGASCNFDKLMDHVGLRQSIAKACATAIMKFPDGAKDINPKFWEDDFTVKRGKTATEAVADIFQGKYIYEIGCTTACRTMMVQGVMDYYKKSGTGKKLMEKLSRNDPLEDASNEIDDRIDYITKPTGKFVGYVENVPHNNWHTGDWGYMRNIYEPSRPENGGRQGEEGSNIVYAGGGKFCSYYEGHTDVTLEAIYGKIRGWWGGKGKSREKIGERWKNSPADDPGFGMLSAIREVPKSFDVGIHESEPVTESLSELLAQFKGGNRRRSEPEEIEESIAIAGRVAEPPVSRARRRESSENLAETSQIEVARPRISIPGPKYSFQVVDQQGFVRNVVVQRTYLGTYNPAENPRTQATHFRQDAESFLSKQTGARITIPADDISNVPAGYTLNALISESVSEPIATQLTQPLVSRQVLTPAPTYQPLPTHRVVNIYQAPPIYNTMPANGYAPRTQFGYPSAPLIQSPSGLIPAERPVW